MGEYFLDTSALVKRYVAEAGSLWVTGLTDLAARNKCHLATLTRVELLAALYRRVRTGSLTFAQAQQAEQAFRHELRTHYVRVPQRAAILNRAMALVVAYPLRAYDAVQLATALYVQSQNTALALPVPMFLCADQNLNRAATAEGLQVDDPNLHP